MNLRNSASNGPLFHVIEADLHRDLQTVLSLYREYIHSTQADLSFQNNEWEFARLADFYDGAGAGIFLALMEGRAVGCAAYRRVDDHICEMKRVYVRPQARGHGIGAALVARVLQAGRASGYRKICLDVLPEFQAALALYRSVGFVPHEPVADNPVPGTAFLGLVLQPDR